MARPAHRPDPLTCRQVEAMAAYGIPEADIATVIGIDPKTLRRHYRRELDTGHIKANTRVAEFLFRKATTDGHQCVTAAIFWLKTRARWKETMVNEIGITHDPIADLFRDIAEHGRRIHDPPLRTIAGVPVASEPAITGTTSAVDSGPKALASHTIDHVLPPTQEPR